MNAERERYNPSIEPAFLTGSGTATTAMASVWTRGNPGDNGGDLYLSNDDLTNDLWVRYDNVVGQPVEQAACYRIRPGETRVFWLTAPLYRATKTLLVGTLAGTAAFSYCFGARYDALAAIARGPFIQ